MTGFGAISLDGSVAAVRFERWYAASAAELWAALTDPERMRRWLGAEVSLEGRVGGAVRLRWQGGEEMDGVALPLFAGVKAFALPGDLPGAATQAVAAIREFGAGMHLLAVAARGLEPAKAHWLTTPHAWESFGYRPADVPAITGLDRERLAQADELTRELLEPAYAVLDEREGDDLLSGLTGLKAFLPVPELPE
jgi:hypothetical protein